MPSVTQLQTLNVGPGIVAARPVGGNIPGIAKPWEFNALQSLTCDIDQKIVSAMGQFKMPFDTAVVDMTIKGTLEVLQLSGDIIANAALGDSPTTGTVVDSYREAYTLTSTAISTRAASTPVTLGEFITDGTNLQVCTVAGTTAASVPTWNTVVGGTTTDGTATWTNCGPASGITNLCVVEVAQAAHYASDGNVMYQTNNVQLGNVSLAPAVGEYTAPGNGVYLFNSADASNSVFITYTYTSSTLGNSYPIMQHTQGFGPILSMNLLFPYQTSGASAMNRALYLSAVRIGKLSFKTKRDGYMTTTFDYEAFCPPNGVAGYFYLPS